MGESFVLFPKQHPSTDGFWAAQRHSPGWISEPDIPGDKAERQNMDGWVYEHILYYS
jgi:hypothetical protein